MDSSVSGKEEFLFLRLCHHVRHELYVKILTCSVHSTVLAFNVLNPSLQISHISDPNLQLCKFLLNTLMGFGVDHMKVERETVRI